METQIIILIMIVMIAYMVIFGIKSNREQKDISLKNNEIGQYPTIPDKNAPPKPDSCAHDNSREDPVLS